MSNGAGMGKQILANAASNSASTLLSGLNNKEHAEATTQSAVANGTVIIRYRVNQKQDVADLSRDTEYANDSISAIFDKEKKQKRLQTAQLAGEISGQMTNIVTTMGDIKGLEKAQSAKNAETLPAGATEKQRGEWLEKMRDSPEYQAEMKQWGIGSTSQKVAQTVGSILTGLVTGNAGQAVAGGLNPWAAQLIKKETTDASGNVDVATNAMAHAVWAAVSSQMSGGSAAAGAAGAFSGELATRYIAEKYWDADTPEKIAALGQEDREQLSLLGTLAAGLAGGMVGNCSAAATSGAIAGKNAVENNELSGFSGFGSGFWSNTQAQGSLKNNTNLTDETGKVLNPATPEEIKYASDKLVTGQLPAGQNAATGLLTAWGAGATTVVAPVLLPSGATAGSINGAGAIGGSANILNQLQSGDPFSATDALIATGISGVTQGKGFWFTEAASITGAYVGASLQGKDAAAPMIGAGLGTLGGATIGKGVDKLQTIIPQFIIPKITGAVAESAGSEYLGSSAQNLAEKVQQKLEKKSDGN